MDMRRRSGSLHLGLWTEKASNILPTMWLFKWITSMHCSQPHMNKKKNSAYIKLCGVIVTVSWKINTDRFVISFTLQHCNTATLFVWKLWNSLMKLYHWSDDYEVNVCVTMDWGFSIFLLLHSYTSGQLVLCSPNITVQALLPVVLPKFVQTTMGCL